MCLIESMHIRNDVHVLLIVYMSFYKGYLWLNDVHILLSDMQMCKRATSIPKTLKNIFSSVIYLYNPFYTCNLALQQMFFQPRFNVHIFV